MAEFYTFSDEAVSAALDAARQTHQDRTTSLAAGPGDAVHSGGTYCALAECIAVTIENHKICIKLPLGLGKHCINIPVNIPNGTAAKACLSICTTLGIPTGVKVSVEVGGVTVVSESFGKC